MFAGFALDHAGTICARINKDQRDITVGTTPVWRTIWDSLQPTSLALRASGGQAYIHHMLASKRLADKFEGGQVDDSMYDQILRQVMLRSYLLK